MSLSYYFYSSYNTTCMETLACHASAHGNGLLLLSSTASEVPYTLWAGTVQSTDIHSFDLCLLFLFSAFDPADSILQMLDCSYELIYEFILFRCTQIRHQTNRRLLPCNWGSWCTRPWRRLVPPVDSDLPSDTWRPGYRSRCWVWES